MITLRRRSRKPCLPTSKSGSTPFVRRGIWAAPHIKKARLAVCFMIFFGGNTLKADVSISVTELGSLLDHTGPHLEAEEYIARTFGAEQSYIVTNGTSTSNKIVGMYAAPSGSTLLIDRNCHKSLAHLLMMNDVVPVWLKPTRNALGILGGIPRGEFTRDSIEEKVAATTQAQWPVHAVITNSTYDGLLYNTDWIKQTLDVPSIHFDSAWVPYTHFHPIYQGKSGMSGERVAGKVIFETQSTHKMLAALSQASLIHIKGEYDEEAFNEAFMMHTTTSPSYPIVASVETAAAMLRGNPGKRLINRSVERALHFRKEVQRLREESDGWFFDIWQPPQVDEAECWPVAPGEQWHGFSDADANHMFLDPVKVTILTPGMDEHGNMSEEGIPAALVAKFLDERGIVVEKTGPYNLLFLFSIGIDKTKAMGLLRGLTEFKRSYDLNLRIKNMLPDLYAEDPDFYRNMRIQDLAQGIHKLIRKHDLPGLMLRAFDTLPEMIMTPHQAWQRQIKGEVETIALEQLVGRVSANMILPYPPGVPLLMPGEMLTEESRTVLDFLLMLCSVGQHYPGFETDIHGAKQDEDGVYRVRVLKMAG
ncbi:lysine decarboxylase LdcC [Escherichia coli]|nr:lysine decarboxylase LdcC [Escherichia coli]